MRIYFETGNYENWTICIVSNWIADFSVTGDRNSAGHCVNMSTCQKYSSTWSSTSFFLGYFLILFELDPRPMLAFNQMTEKYGNLLGLNLQKVEMVIMSRYDDLKSLLNIHKIGEWREMSEGWCWCSIYLAFGKLVRSSFSN